MTTCSRSSFGMFGYFVFFFKPSTRFVTFGCVFNERFREFDAFCFLQNTCLTKFFTGDVSVACSRLMEWSGWSNLQLTQNEDWRFDACILSLDFGDFARDRSVLLAAVFCQVLCSYVLIAH